MLLKVKLSKKKKQIRKAKNRPVSIDKTKLTPEKSRGSAGIQLLCVAAVHEVNGDLQVTADVTRADVVRGIVFSDDEAQSFGDDDSDISRTLVGRAVTVDRLEPPYQALVEHDGTADAFETDGFRITDRGGVVNVVPDAVIVGYDTHVSE
jgi:hypothetical protein